MSKFDIVKNQLECKYPGTTLIRLNFKNLGKYAVMYVGNNRVIPISYKTLRDVVDRFDLT